MPIAERIREKTERRRQREITLKRMEPSTRPHLTTPPSPPTVAVSVERSAPSRSNRRRKQWTFHFTITLSLPTFSLGRSRQRLVEVRDRLGESHTIFVRRTRRRLARFKESLPSISHALHHYRRARARKKAARATARRDKAQIAAAGGYSSGGTPYRQPLPRQSPQLSQRAAPLPPAKPHHLAAPAHALDTSAPRTHPPRSYTPRHVPTHSAPNHHVTHHGHSSQRGVACPLCRTATVASRWQGSEECLRLVGISARRCPRCLHRFYCEPLVFRPLRKAVVHWNSRNRRARKKPPQ